jgi:hypothetical protein
MKTAKHQNNPDLSNRILSSPVTHALVIGFLIGIAIYSAASGSWGVGLLIPLYFVYRMTRKKSKGQDALDSAPD